MIIYLQELNIKFKNIFPLILFLIPFIPHAEIYGPYIHTDDIPVFLFLTIAIFYILKEKMYVLGLTGKFLFIFLFYIILQNFYLNNTFLSSDIYRFTFYIVLYIYTTNMKEKNQENNIPLLSFLLLSIFSVLSFLFEINLGNDGYQTWNIGFNPSELDYLKGRVNGFQAGGPNSFADLVTVLSIYCIYKYKNVYSLFIAPLALIAVAVTYSRFSLIVLVLFLISKLVKEKLYSYLFLFLCLLFIIGISLGIYERFINDDNNGISDRVLMLESSIDYYLESSVVSKMIGNGSNELIFQSSNVYLIDDFKENPYSYGPHNSFIFYLINYGLFGLILYLLVFYELLKKGRKSDFNLITILAFLVLSLTTDLLHNHSVSWFFYFVYFSYLKIEN